MKKLIAVAFAVVFVLVTAAPAAVTPASHTEFEGFIHFCGGSPPDTVIETPGGKTLHIRGGSNFNEWVTGNPLIDGPETNSPNVNFNPTSGAVHLDATIYPDAAVGTWEIAQTLNFRGDGSFSSHGVGHGTGELHGMTIKFTTGDPVVTDNPCSDLPSAPLSGVIVSPAVNG